MTQEENRSVDRLSNFDLHLDSDIKCTRKQELERWGYGVAVVYCHDDLLFVQQKA
jgi:hypothetical protein